MFGWRDIRKQQISAVARGGAGGPLIIMERWREKVEIDELSTYMS